MLSRLAGSVLLASLVVGCANKPVEEAVVTADSMTIIRVRDALQKLDPSACVGQVTEVSPEQNWAAVGNIPTADLKEGNIVTFLDGNQKVLTTGKIIRIQADSIHVKYDAPAAGGRAPVVNDLAVRFN